MLCGGLKRFALPWRPGVWQSLLVVAEQNVNNVGKFHCYLQFSCLHSVAKLPNGVFVPVSTLVFHVVEMSEPVAFRTNKYCIHRGHNCQELSPFAFLFSLLLSL